MVVVISPSDKFGLCFAERSEPLHIQTFVTKTTGKALNKPVLNRPSRSNKTQLDTGLHSPCFHGTSDELAAIVQSDAARWPSAFLTGTAECRHHFLSVHRPISFQPDTLACKLIDHRQDANGAAICKLVADKISRPAVIRARGLALRNSCRRAIFLRSTLRTFRFSSS